MVNHRALCRPVIAYRSIRPSDFEILEKIHGELFPIRYETEFFHNVVNGNIIVSWGAVDHNRPDGKSNELIGFVTAKLVSAKESEIDLDFDSSKPDQTLLYILTLGVVESYRNLGIARSLINEVLKHAKSISTCRAVYLHVISYNNPAMHLYKKMSFKCLRRLYNFYFIDGQHYDSYLFVYFVNGGRSPCSPLELVALLVSCTKNGFKSVASKLWRNEEVKRISKWPKCNESGSLLPTTVHNKRMMMMMMDDGCQFP